MNARTATLSTGEAGAQFAAPAEAEAEEPSHTGGAADASMARSMALQWRALNNPSAFIMADGQVYPTSTAPRDNAASELVAETARPDQAAGKEWTDASGPRSRPHQAWGTTAQRETAAAHRARGAEA